MQTKDLCILIYLRTKDEVGIVKFSYCPFQSSASFLGFICYLMPASCSLVFTCWKRAGLLAFLYIMLVSWVRCGT